MYDSGGQRKYLTRSEADAFIAQARKENVPVYSFCWFMAATGCRISEALATTINCIDFESGHVIIRCLKKRQKRVFRAVPLPAKLLNRLKSWIASGTLGEKDRLWPWSRMTGYRRITEVMLKARILGPWATPRGLRHGFGIRAIQAGVPLNMVQRWLGHADLKTTAIYACAIGPEEREIAARTWLEQDIDYERKISQQTEDEVQMRISGRLPLGATTELRPKWSPKRLFSDLKRTGTCQLIQFWLFCNSVS